MTLWGLLVTIGILSTLSAAPSSLEGMLYSRLPMWYHLMGFPEILLQTIVFGSSSIPTVLGLGFFPAIIITFSTWMNYRKPVTQERGLI